VRFEASITMIIEPKGRCNTTRENKCAGGKRALGASAPRRGSPVFSRPEIHRAARAGAAPCAGAISGRGVLPSPGTPRLGRAAIDLSAILKPKFL
jgi:hypothetical protein